MIDPRIVGSAMMHINGLRIIENPHLIKSYQFRFPRSKKSRIRKKWSKQQKNFREKPDTESIYKTPHEIICHPILADRLRREISKL